MKVGDYVRTKDGKIFKIENINEYYIYVLDTKCSLSEDDKTCFYMPNKDEPYKIVKSSPNIIDLIEVGDYVNGNRVDFTNSNNKLSYENKCIGFYDGDGDITLFEKDIKTMVTREMFESMEYKVGEE